MLDNFETVQQAVDTLQTEPFTVVTAKVPGEERLATVHLSLSDATGDSAIVEYSTADRSSITTANTW